ncbi:sialin [Culex quinquefasciatus]|uniref:Sialin n=1 Tax=Culex quinquefasciatus TaxID=7176 RepID=B0WK23_CULQU|nr:sialin [Culex quinquefasciatus]|eukprot:XP_001849057.1 sialin [Culex quinquefasciatus]
MDPGQSSKLSDGIDAPWWKIWAKRRNVVMLMAFFCMQVVYLTRLSLNVTVDAMKADLGQSWDSEQLVRSFFYGLLVTQIPGGFLASKFGCTNVITVGIAGTSVLTIFTPLAAYGGAGWIIAVRFLQGLFQGVVFPCLIDLWARWAPPSERTNMVMVTFVGIIVGTIKAMFIGEPLVVSVSWESVFYIFGGAGCLWCVAWIKMIRKSPDEDRSITDGEKEFIMQTLGNVEGQSGGVKHPWKGIFTSTAVLACAVASFCQNWGIVNNLNMFPTFLKDTLNYELSPTGFLTTLPYVSAIKGLTIGGPLADRLQVKGLQTATQVRRNFTCASFIAQLIFMLAGVLVHDSIAAIILMTIAVAMGSFAWAGYVVNLLDMSPKSAGVMMGVVGTFGTVADIVSPVVTGNLTANNTVEEWNAVFFVTAGLYLLGCAVYWFLASGELQPCIPFLVLTGAVLRNPVLFTPQLPANFAPHLSFIQLQTCRITFCRNAVHVLKAEPLAGK